MHSTVICSGLSCVDVQLHGTAIPQTLEAVTTFSHTSITPGGSVPQTCRALSLLRVKTAAVTLAGDDLHGSTLKKVLCDEDIDVSSVQLRSDACTSMAVLPLFVDGRRGCYVSIGANSIATPSNLLPRTVIDRLFTDSLKVFHFGYPHLMPKLKGAALCHLFQRVREASPKIIITLDVNGADAKEVPANPVLIPALPYTSVIHANLEEACIISGYASPSQCDKMSAVHIKQLTSWFLDQGVGLVSITCGKDGVFMATLASPHPAHNLSHHLERGAFIYRAAYQIAEGTKINASGAGDAFIAGLISELANSAGSSGIVRLADAGLVSSLMRIDPSFMPKGADVDTLLAQAQNKSRIPPRQTLQPFQYEVS